MPVDDPQDVARWHHPSDRIHVVVDRPAPVQKVADSAGWACRFPADGVALLQHPAAGASR